MRAPHLAVALSLLGTLVAVDCTGLARAQPAPQAAPEAPAKEVALTQKLIDDLLAAHGAISAIESKIPESAQGAPSPRVMAQLDAAATKYGFANYAAYQEATGTVSMVMSGFDFETKRYIGPEAVLKRQIAEIQTDKTMSAADKKEALAELTESLKSAAAIKPMPANIDLVGKNFDKLGEVFQQDE
jgi:hypothetical protein